MRRTLPVLAVLLLVATACSTGPGPAAPAEPGLVDHAGHTAAPAPPSEPLRDGERFVDLRMANPYLPVPPRGGTDQYRCFLVDPQLAAPAYVTGAQFLPENPAVVHHAILFRIGPDDVAKAKSLDAADDGDGWTCFSGTGIGGGGRRWATARLAAGRRLARGLGPRRPGDPGQCGHRLPARGRQPDRDAGPLQPAGDRGQGAGHRPVGGAAAGGGRVGRPRPLQTTLLPAPIELPCAPGRVGPAVRPDHGRAADVGNRFGYAAQLAVTALNYLQPRPGADARHHPALRPDRAGRRQVQAVAGHMHLLGRSIKVELNPGTPEGAHAARRAGLQLRRPERPPGRRAGHGRAGRHAAGHLHPRREPALRSCRS